MLEDDYSPHSEIEPYAEFEGGPRDFGPTSGEARDAKDRMLEAKDREIVKLEEQVGAGQVGGVGGRLGGWTCRRGRAEGSGWAGVGVWVAGWVGGWVDGWVGGTSLSIRTASVEGVEGGQQLGWLGSSGRGPGGDGSTPTSVQVSKLLFPF